jgi:protein-disulfide isomerase
MKEGSALKLTGTPSVIINGERIDLNKISSVDLFRGYLDNLLNSTSTNSTSTQATSTVN